MNKTRIQVIEKSNHVFVCKIRKEHFYIQFGKKYGTLKDALDTANAMAWMVGGCPVRVMNSEGKIVQDMEVKEIKMNDTFDYQVDDIMSHFNFENVHKAMVAVDWKWAMLDGTWNGRVPTTEELRASAQRLLDEAAKSNSDTYISTGGFTVLRIGPALQLLFILEDQGEELHVEGVNWPGKKK